VKVRNIEYDLNWLGCSSIGVHGVVHGIQLHTEASNHDRRKITT
jgi:hypothetical protein